MGKILDFNFTGPLGELTAYKMRGMDRIIVRRKGGASKQRIKNDPNFDHTRRNNSEFGGRATAAKWIMRMLQPQKALGDYNIAGPLNALIKPIQVLDSKNEKGKRSVLLSKNPRLLEGFSLNRRNPFDSILRTSLSYSLSRDTLSAHIDLPALLPGINFYAPQSYPMYSVIAVLGVVPDLVYTELGYQPLNAKAYETLFPKMAKTDWYPVLSGSPATTLELNFGTVPSDQSFSLILTIGIQFGAMRDVTTVEQVKYAGSARVLAMG